MFTGPWQVPSSVHTDGDLGAVISGCCLRPLSVGVFCYLAASVIDMHLLLGGAILTLSRLGGAGLGETPGILQKDTVGQKQLPEEDPLGVLKPLEKAGRLRVDYVGAF